MKSKGKTIKTHKFYAAWDYKKEEQDLNEASMNGRQLVYGGMFHSEFLEDKNIRYLYQLDYNPRVKEKERYCEFFEQQKWEYVNSTGNGWHYFRKQYQEGMDPSEYSIYTDKQSLHEMQNKWICLITILFILCILLAVIYIVIGCGAGQILLVMESMIFVGLAILLGFGLYDSRKKQRE